MGFLRSWTGRRLGFFSRRPLPQRFIRLPCLSSSLASRRCTLICPVPEPDPITTKRACAPQGLGDFELEQRFTPAPSSACTPC